MTKTARDMMFKLSLFKWLDDVRESLDGPTVECIALLLEWRNSPDVILAATERIHEVTKERMEAQR